MNKHINKIINIDNLIGIRELDNQSIDLIITSPPYGILRDYEGFYWNSEELIKQMFIVLKEGGVCVWVIGDSVVNGSETAIPFKQVLQFLKTGFNLHDTMIYEKNGSSLPDPTRYLQCFEFMFIFSKGKPKTINFIEDRKNKYTGRWGRGRTIRNKDGTLSLRNSDYHGKEYGRRFNIWRYNTGYGYSTKDEIAWQHPAIFPEELVKDHIISWSNENDIILDPFIGSGTTAKMAILTNRKYIGFEISKKYCELAEKRIEPYLLQGILL